LAFYSPDAFIVEALTRDGRIKGEVATREKRGYFEVERISKGR
jgi:hypothetical protein